MIAVVSPSSTSTSGRACVGMKPCTKALYVSLIIRCDSAAIVPKTSELLPEPETPVNTVSRRFGISMLTFLRLFSRAMHADHIVVVGIVQRGRLRFHSRGHVLSICSAEPPHHELRKRRFAPI